jgi:hypothetical protein
MLRQLQVLIAALFTAMTLCSCNLDLGSGTTSAEIDQVLAERIAAENAANQPAATPTSNDGGGDTPAAAPATPTPTAKPSTAVSSGGGGGFLWKPVSDSNGNLVVILPSQYNGKVSSVSVNGERGSFSGIANGNRTHWRFSKPGAAYGSNARVVATTSGGNVSWTVPNGGARTTL